MKRFRYGFDPLCVAACCAYAIIRWAIPVHLKGPFLAGHASDLLLIPAALPLVLWLQRGLGLRRHDGAPTVGEIGLHLAVWAVMAEWVAPLVVRHAVSDWRDLVAYAAGAFAAAVWWRRRSVSSAAAWAGKTA